MGRIAFQLQKFYCNFGCPLDPDARSYANAFMCKNHVTEVHGVDDPEEGRHFLQGWQAQKKRQARLIVAQTAVMQVEKVFKDPNYGPDDLLADAGDSPPDLPPWPKETEA